MSIVDRLAGSPPAGATETVVRDAAPVRTVPAWAFSFPPSGERELRLDLFRGLALWLIFIDHVSPDLLTWFTIRNYGFSDAAEYRAGTNPLDPASALRLIDVSADGQTFTIKWSAVTGRSYRVQSTDTVTAPNWQDCSGIVFAPWAEASVATPLGPGTGNRFYRVVLADQP